ncbi:alpha/beta fold hydrolase [Mucilaginibacter arboris]|uniref:Alpha/beta fold hydrolase n=1 Tax=Mucilaginibacter arboris TaxID=2682090 RepID=A0A7K1T072_9SPHI|nr:alpha/beta hydrolase [Mucilaginibacter arboris]MVN22965.1 alpha/beta fold hydrolase [Mucilaginibacter arboris]
MDPLAVLKRNNVKTIGKGSKTLLFAHGFGCDQNVWQFVLGAFTDEYRIVLFDYTGSGNSEKSRYDSAKYASIDGYVQDVLDICEALELKETIFIGHSVSSMVGLLAAIKNPEYFEKLIFIGPSPRYLNAENYEGGFEKEDLDSLFEFMDSNYLGWSSAMAPAIMGNADRPELGTLLTSNFCATDPQIARDFARVTFFSDNRTDLKNLTIKSLTLQCAQDILAPLEVGKFVHAHTPGNEIVFLKATGHCPHISAPDETIRAIKTFLN